MCGVYDPAQAKIEAMSVLKCTKAAESDDAVFKDRAILIKEERADLVKHHPRCCGPISSSRTTSSSTEPRPVLEGDQEGG